jgi:hypothetical protein
LAVRVLWYPMAKAAHGAMQIRELLALHGPVPPADQNWDWVTLKLPMLAFRLASSQSAPVDSSVPARSKAADPLQVLDVELLFAQTTKCPRAVPEPRWQRPSTGDSAEPVAEALGISLYAKPLVDGRGPLQIVGRCCVDPIAPARAD